MSDCAKVTACGCERVCNVTIGAPGAVKREGRWFNVKCLNEAEKIRKKMLDTVKGWRQRN